MAARTLVLRIVLVVAFCAAVAVALALLLARPAPLALGTGPSPAPTVQTPEPTQDPVEAPEPATPEQAEVVPVAEEDPATVFVDDDFDELPPVDLDEEADYGNDVVVTIDELERVHGKGTGPGEVAGPSVLVELTLRNDSDDDVDLGAVVVDLYTESEALGTPLMGDPRTAPFEGVAAPGDEVRASYVIRVPDDSPQIKVTVSYEAETPAVTFLGEV
ncbi:MAG: hypothetical protein GX593_10185 [Actinomycetales bacterium]|nr:hypothetical protein [Actinomycetales bacterium]